MGGGSSKETEVKANPAAYKPNANKGAQKT